MLVKVNVAVADDASGVKAMVAEGVAVEAKADTVNAARVCATVVPNKSGVETLPVETFTPQARLANARIKPPAIIRHKRVCILSPFLEVQK